MKMMKLIWYRVASLWMGAFAITVSGLLTVA